MRALAAHATQVMVDGPFFALSNNIGHAPWATSTTGSSRVTPPAPYDADGRETDLFNGLLDDDPAGSPGSAPTASDAAYTSVYAASDTRGSS